MHHRYLLSIVLFAGTCSSALADPPSLLRMFGKNSAAKPIQSDSYALSKEDGPWLILAATFVGEESKQRAERLVQEIRRDLRLPAYTYREKFDFTGNINSRDRSAPKMRYANEFQYTAYAVLVGEYDSVQHRSLEGDLSTIRSANPNVFRNQKDEPTVEKSKSPIDVVNAIKNKWMRASKNRRRGPMGNAFVTRNPLLPEEYFSAPQVDSFVNQLNADKKFSLLKCKGKYTVIVRTFEGMETIVDGRSEKKFLPSLKRLDKYAADAAKMTAKIRADGDEAYQFHDRFKSIVTVGSFDELGRVLPDGRYEYAADIRRVMKKYSAFNAKVARSVAGQNGVAANHAALIPFDIKPSPIAVPKPTKRSLYSAAFGKR